MSGSNDSAFDGLSNKKEIVGALLDNKKEERGVEGASHHTSSDRSSLTRLMLIFFFELSLPKPRLL
jgi:hypothetical protein